MLHQEMINKEKAIQITENFIKNNDLYSVNETSVKTDHITDKEFAWYVPFGEDESVPENSVSAYNGLIIDKATGEFMQPGSVFDLDDWMFGFRIGLRGGLYNFIITAVHQQDKAIDLMHRLHLRFFGTEAIKGTVWNVPKKYSKEMIKEKILHLPCEFKSQDLTYAMEIFKEAINNNLFEFKLVPVND